MFFKSKKETAQKAETAPVIEKKELLYRENIRTGCAPATKQEAILVAGKMLGDRLCRAGICRGDARERKNMFHIHGKRTCSSTWC